VDKPLITSRSNAYIKQAQALRHRKIRAETGSFLVEGIHPVGEAIEAGWEIESILYSPETLTSKFATDMLARFPINARPVSAKLMESLSEKDNPQGVMAVVKKQTIRFDDLGTIHTGAALASPQDPGNVGTILRTLDAVKANILFLLDGGVDPYHPTSVRASMGTIFWIPIVQTSFTEFVVWSKKCGLRVIGTSAHAELDYRKTNSEKPWILLLGSEQKGLSKEQSEACDLMISLPMRGHASSLNLAVAASVLLYQLNNRA
jgi:TrmH family RNA methyltransferase